MHKTLGLHTSSQVEVVHCQNVTMHFAWGNIDPRFTAFFTDKHKTWNLLQLPTPNYLILPAKFDKILKSTKIMYIVGIDASSSSFKYITEIGNTTDLSKIVHFEEDVKTLIVGIYHFTKNFFRSHCFMK